MPTNFVFNHLNHAEIPPELIQTLLRVVPVLDNDDVQHGVVGAVAAALCGQSRTTKVVFIDP